MMRAAQQSNSNDWWLGAGSATCAEKNGKEAPMLAAILSIF